jgi:D-beta-D-heptose 7-phosphate kinase/D-beta-D-heptose 1-phosphate adenosyltransferase
VAANIVALGGRVSLAGVIGKDDAGRRLRAQIEATGIRSEGLVEDPGRPTTEKVRIVTERNQQVARVDYEDETEIGAAIESQVLDRVRAQADVAQALLVSDYLKGTITHGVMAGLIRLRSAVVPLLVDPKIPHLDYYRGATLVTPNALEAEAATYRRIVSDEDARAAAADLRATVGCDAALITRGEHGMWLSSAGAEGGIPAAAREVSDVTGAGDTVVAVLALALAARATLSEAAILANHAAGIVVGRFGPATVNGDELLAEF